MIPIFMYHRVTEVPRELDPAGLAVPPDQFKQQMSYLAKKGYLCLTLPEAVRRLRNSGRAQPKSFVLTFDDGYQDMLRVACPILEQFGFTATIFLVAGQMGSPSDWPGQDGARSSMLLSWAEAQDLSKRGFVLGSHTLSHAQLGKMDDQSALKEIRDSRFLLQERLNAPVDYFSYPYSSSDARTERLVESVGYKLACAGDSGPWSLFHLWRVPCCRDDTSLSFALKASGWYGRRTALRESAPGRLLRRSVRKLRHRPTAHRRPTVWNADPGGVPEGDL